MTTVYLIGNWKQHGSRASIAAFASQWSFEGHEQLAVAIAPPFPYIGELGATLPDCLLAPRIARFKSRGRIRVRCLRGCLLMSVAVLFWWGTLSGACITVRPMN